MYVTTIKLLKRLKLTPFQKKWLPKLPHWLLGLYLVVHSLETFNVFLFDGWFRDYFVVIIILLSQKKNTSRFNFPYVPDFFMYLFCRRTNWPVKECWDNEDHEFFQIQFYTQRTNTASFLPGNMYLLNLQQSHAIFT